MNRILGLFMLLVCAVYSAQTPFGPQLAGDGHGRVACVWSEKDSTYFVIKESEIAMGSSWSSPRTLSFTTHQSLFPTITMNLAGTIFAAWQGHTSLDSEIFFSFRSFGSTAPSSQGTISFFQTKPLNSRFPVAVLDENNQASLVWTAEDSTHNYLLAGSSCSPRDRRAPAVLLSFATPFLFQAQLGINDEGTVSAVWTTGPLHSTVIALGVVPLDGHEKQQGILSNPSITSLDPTLAICGNQGFAAWQVSTSPFSSLSIANLSNLSMPPHLLALPDVSLSKPAISCNASGALMLIAQCDQPETSSLVFTFCDAEGAWSDLTPLATTTSGHFHSVQVRLNDANQAVAVWVLQADTQKEIQTAVFDSLNGWSDPVTLSSQEKTCSNPALYFDNTEYAVIAWKATQGKTSFIESCNRSSFNGDWTLSAPVLP